MLTPCLYAVRSVIRASVGVQDDVLYQGHPGQTGVQKGPSVPFVQTLLHLRRPLRGSQDIRNGCQDDSELQSRAGCARVMFARGLARMASLAEARDVERVSRPRSTASISEYSSVKYSEPLFKHDHHPPLQVPDRDTLSIPQAW